MAPSSADPIRILALCRGGWMLNRYRYLFQGLNWEVAYDDAWETPVLDRIKPDLLLGLSDSTFRTVELARAARERRIPSLLMMDGILEWRHIWENPRFARGGKAPYFQPVSYDKIACYGISSLRYLETWGNVGKCELVGDPRFDGLIDRAAVTHEGPRRLIVLSANTPGYTREQKEIAQRAFLDLRDILAELHGVEVVWLLRKGMDGELGFVAGDSSRYGSTLAEILPQMDAAICQPSTVVIEAQMVGLPTAVVEYAVVPQYVQAAWWIKCREHIRPVIRELLDPPASHMVFQDAALHSEIECCTPARPRLLKLIEMMVALGREARRSGASLALPDRILPSDYGGHAIPSERFDLAALFPSHPAFGRADKPKLQLDLANARQEIEELRREVVRLRKRGIFATFLRKLVGAGW